MNTAKPVWESWTFWGAIGFIGLAVLQKLGLVEAAGLVDLAKDLAAVVVALGLRRASNGGLTLKPGEGPGRLPG